MFDNAGVRFQLAGQCTHLRETAIATRCAGFSTSGGLHACHESSRILLVNWSTQAEAHVAQTLPGRETRGCWARNTGADTAHENRGGWTHAVRVYWARRARCLSCRVLVASRRATQTCICFRVGLRTASQLTGVRRCKGIIGVQSSCIQIEDQDTSGSAPPNSQKPIVAVRTTTKSVPNGGLLQESVGRGPKMPGLMKGATAVAAWTSAC